MKVLQIMINPILMLGVVLSLVSLPTHAVYPDEIFQDIQVSALVSGQEHLATYAGDSGSYYKWRILSQYDWPDSISLKVKLQFKYYDWPNSVSTDNWQCDDTATISSENPPFQQQIATEETDWNNFIFTATGVTTNRSLSPAIYFLRVTCRSYNPINKKQMVFFDSPIAIRIDADTLTDWEPGTTGDAKGLVIVFPQEGATLTDSSGRLDLKFQATELIPSWVDVTIQKAGVVDDTGLIGDISLPGSKKVYGSQWETILQKTYNWPKGESTLNIRHGLAGPGLYSILAKGEAWGNQGPMPYHIGDMGPIYRTFIYKGIQKFQAAESKVKPAVSTKAPPADVLFGSKAGRAPAAVAPTPESKTSYAETVTRTQPVIKPMQDMSQPMSGPAPRLQTQPITRAPAVAAPVPMAGTRVDPATQKAPVQVDLQPQLPRQVTRIPQPVITYPTPNMTFTAPANFTAKARLVGGMKATYFTRKMGVRAEIKSNDGRFANLAPGRYCVYVRYNSSGLSSHCVPFSVNLAVKRAPALQTTPKPVVQPAPTIAPKPVSPAPMRKTQPTPMTPGG